MIQKCFVSKLTSVATCVAVVCVPSVIGNISPVDIVGLGVVRMFVWVGDSVGGVIVVVLDRVTGLVLDAVDSTFDVVTAGLEGVIEEKDSSPSEVEDAPTVS